MIPGISLDLAGGREPTGLAAAMVTELTVSVQPQVHVIGPANSLLPRPDRRPPAGGPLSNVDPRRDRVGRCHADAVDLQGPIVIQ